MRVVEEASMLPAILATFSVLPSLHYRRRTRELNLLTASSNLPLRWRYGEGTWLTSLMKE